MAASQHKEGMPGNYEEEQLRKHLAAVRRHLEDELGGFGELDLALADLSDLEARASSGRGPCVEILEALDAAMAAQDTDMMDSGAELTIEIEGDEDTSLSPQQQAEVVAFMGDYLSLFRHMQLARDQYVTALKLDEDNFHALLGLSKITVSAVASKEGEDADVARCQALDMVLRCIRLLTSLATTCEKHSEALSCGLSWERDVCQCIHLLDNIGDLFAGLDSTNCTSSRCQKGVLEFLSASSVLLHTSATSAIENLARKWFISAPWLQRPLDCVDVITAPLPQYIGALLTRSQTFCHAGLERYVACWRAMLSSELLQAPSIAAKSAGLVSQIGNAAAVACHCHFVGYCIPYHDDESEVKVLQAGRAKLHLQSDATEHMHISLPVLVLLAMYEAPSSDLPCTPVSELFPDLKNMPDCDTAVLALLDHMLDRFVKRPRQEAELAAEIDLLMPGTCLPDTPCREFYDETVYPPWHGAIESAGVMPLIINERLQRLYPWYRGTQEAKTAAPRRSRILIAGCGSGHQIGVELRTYENCDIVALDCSLRTAAYARRQLRAVLSKDDFKRIHFVVGDILQIGEAGVATALKEGNFDLVVCCGVLHHLKRPDEGLARLTAVLAPGGVLQLATYSKCSVDSWHGKIQKYLRSLPAARHLYNASGSLLRMPSHSEVRAIRQHVLSLPAGTEIRDLLVHFREFFSRAGILDLLFHPLETSFTLLELRHLLQGAQLQVIGVFFGDVNVDLAARKKFRLLPNANDDPRMLDLAKWHALEDGDPDLFGRMHNLFLERGTEATVTIESTERPGMNSNFGESEVLPPATKKCRVE